jgi:DNA topoisomerase-3
MDATYPDMTAHWEHQLQGMAERNQAYQPFMQALEQRIDGLMGEVKSGPIPDSLRHLPKVERPAFKRKKRSYSKGGASKSSSGKRKSS